MERRFYEYRGMRGGEHYERMEANPMIGYRGCFRNVAESVSAPFRCFWDMPLSRRSPQRHLWSAFHRRFHFDNVKKSGMDARGVGLSQTDKTIRSVVREPRLQIGGAAVGDVEVQVLEVIQVGCGELEDLAVRQLALHGLRGGGEPIEDRLQLGLEELRIADLGILPLREKPAVHLEDSPFAAETGDGLVDAGAEDPRPRRLVQLELEKPPCRLTRV